MIIHGKTSEDWSIEMTKRKCSMHIFILPPPNGQESLGVCKYCGAKKMHYNSVPDNGSPWQRTKKATWKTKVALEQ